MKQSTKDKLSIASLFIGIGGGLFTLGVGVKDLICHKKDMDYQCHQQAKYYAYYQHKIEEDEKKAKAEAKKKKAETKEAVKTENK